MTKVSVIIPIYETEQYIERCAISLFEQTLKDIEYIFINDCSKDQSLDVLKKVLQRYPNRINQVKIIDLPRNCGQAAVRKIGIEHASGEYVIHCDSDDWIATDAYEKLYACAQVNNSDIVFCDFYISDGILHTLKKRIINTISKDTVLKDVSHNVCWSLCGALIKRSICQSATIKFPSDNNGEDFVLMSQYLYYAESFSKINEGLYYYYKNPFSITNNLTETAFLDRFKQLKNNTDLVIEFFKDQHALIKFDKYIMCYKVYCKTKLSPITNKKEYYELWNSIYPEVNIFSVCTNPIIPFRTKINYILVIARIYHFLTNKR